MSQNELCRICASSLESESSNKLFEPENSALLHTIEILTGLELENLPDLPQCICQLCEEQAIQASQFRERCVHAQLYFASVDYKEQQLLKQEPFYELEEEVQESNFEHDEEEEEVAVEVDGAVCKEAVECEEDSMILVEVKSTISEEDPDFDDDFTFDEEVQVFNTRWGHLDTKFENADLEADVEDVGDIGFDQVEEPEEFLDGENILKAKIQKPERPPPKYITSLKPRQQRGAKKREKRIYICEVCGNHFPARDRFRTHMQRHEGNKTFHCEVCPSKFFTLSELTRHMRRHTGERPFACKHCGRRFTDYSTRTKHERTHTNERPYSCMECGKAFSRSYLLNRHMVVHTGERLFKCALCNRDFQSQSHLLVHNRSIMHKQNEEKQQLKPSIKYEKIIDGE